MRTILVRALIAAFAVLLASAGSARAEPESFERLAAAAQSVQSPRALASLFWSLTEKCAGVEGDLERRQCEGVRSARAARVTRDSYLVTSGGGAVHVGPFDTRKKSMPIAVEACVLCSEPPEVDGKKLYVVGQGRHRVAGGEVRAAQLFESARTFDTETAAAAWSADVLPRLRTDFVIRLPGTVEGFAGGGASGYKVQVVGYRVYDPCDGNVLFARPSSGAAPIDRSACKQQARPAEPEPAAKPEPRQPQLPERLTPGQVREAMRPVHTAAQACFDAYGVSGTARFQITFSGEGAVVALEQRGEFRATPTGECIEKAVREVKFPRSQKPRTTIDYPIMVR
jgi:hypothetical protein